MAERLGWRFAKLWTASTTSALGSGLAIIAAPLFVAAHTKSPLIVSATSGVAWLPWLLFALPGGVLVDRVDRRRLMVAIDWARVAAMAVRSSAGCSRRASPRRYSRVRGPPRGPPVSVVSPVLSTNPGTDSTLRWKFPACSRSPQTVS